MFSIDIDFGFKGKDSISYKNVQIKFALGDIVNIIGENGCGKSSFYKVLMGKNKPTRGEIASDINNNVVVVSDYVGLPNECSVLDVVDFIGNEKNEYLKENFEEIYNYVLDMKDKEVSVLSTGQKRVLEIYCALSNQKKILILDEASNGLDIYNRQILIEQIKKLSATKKIAVFNTTHHIEDVVDVGGKIMVMNKHKGFITEYCGAHEMKDVVAFMRGAANV